MARASRWLRVIPATFRSSATTVSYRRARSVVVLCSASARTLAARAWMRASRAADLAPAGTARLRAGVSAAGAAQPAQRRAQRLRSGHGDHVPAIIHSGQQSLDAPVDA